MSVIDIFQWIFNLTVVAALAICFVRLKRPPKDDPRLSKGLQLLQSKIAVLEDLSDRTELQISQMNKLLDLKTGQIQNSVQQAETQIRKVEIAIAKSKEVAEIFQDKIPHDEIVERRATIKYVQAARLAHQGMPVAEIAENLKIPKAEAEFIAKVNKDELMFDEALLPEWAHSNEGSSNKVLSDLEYVADDQEPWRLEEVSPSNRQIARSRLEVVPQKTQAQISAAAAADFSRAFSPSDSESVESLKSLGDQFRDAVQDFEVKNKEEELQEPLPVESSPENSGQSSQFLQAASVVTQKIVDRASDILNSSLAEAAIVTKTSQQRAVNEDDRRVKVTPSDYRRNFLADFRGASKEVDNEDILKVKFPNIDINDGLN